MNLMDIQAELKKTIIEYETKFNRAIPGWRCSDEERLEQLEEAIASDTPYPEDDEHIVY